MRGKRVVTGLLIVLVVLAIAGWLGVRWVLSPLADTPAPVEFEVLPGWGAARVAAELKEQGLIRSARAFTLYVRWQDMDRAVGEGLYDLDPAMDVPQIAALLEAGGRPRIARVVIPEGFRASAVVARLVSAGLGSAEQYAELADDPQALGLPEPEVEPVGDFGALEGYLFPASYDIPVRSTPEQVLQTLTDRFEQEVSTWITEALEELGLSVHEWVTLASIVQSEAGSTAEMPIIAGVFLNRLDMDMPLQSDPTVAYGLNKALPELNVSAGDMQADHPWNTYVHPEIPPGPISSPGADALHAVLEPERLNPEGEPWLYFLHGADAGEPVFRPNTTYEAHVRDIDRYLR